MLIIQDKNLSNFDFWSVAEDTVKELYDDELDTIESTLDELYPNGIDESKLNDIFWFERDWIAEILGYNDWEDLKEKHKEDE